MKLVEAAGTRIVPKIADVRDFGVLQAAFNDGVAHRHPVPTRRRVHRSFERRSATSLWSRTVP